MGVRGEIEGNLHVAGTATTPVGPVDVFALRAHAVVTEGAGDVGLEVGTAEAVDLRFTGESNTILGEVTQTLTGKLVGVHGVYVKEGGTESVNLGITGIGNYGHKGSVRKEQVTINGLSLSSRESAAGRTTGFGQDQGKRPGH